MALNRAPASVVRARIGQYSERFAAPELLRVPILSPARTTVDRCHRLAGTGGT